MSLSRDDIESIAMLARLEISDAEVPNYVNNLSNIIDFVQQLNQAKTNDVVPMAHPLDTHQRLRDDAVNEVDQRELFQRNAAETENGLYLVPKVIE